MDDLDPELKDDVETEEEDAEGDIEDLLVSGKKKPKAKDDDLLSLDDLGEEEEEVLPEDGFDDVDLY
jgi:hypothetical protein